MILNYSMHAFKRACFLIALFICCCNGGVSASERVKPHSFPLLSCITKSLVFLIAEGEKSPNRLHWYIESYARTLLKNVSCLVDDFDKDCASLELRKKAVNAWFDTSVLPLQRLYEIWNKLADKPVHEVALMNEVVSFFYMLSFKLDFKRWWTSSMHAMYAGVMALDFKGSLASRKNLFVCIYDDVTFMPDVVLCPGRCSFSDDLSATEKEYGRWGKDIWRCLLLKKLRVLASLDESGEAQKQFLNYYRSLLCVACQEKFEDISLHPAHTGPAVRRLDLGLQAAVRCFLSQARDTASKKRGREDQ